jgi:hypothetical protein
MPNVVAQISLGTSLTDSLTKDQIKPRVYVGYSSCGDDKDRSQLVAVSPKAAGLVMDVRGHSGTEVQGIGSASKTPQAALR